DDASHGPAGALRPVATSAGWQVVGQSPRRAGAMLIPQPEHEAAGSLARAHTGPQLGPQLERHRAVREGLRRSEFNLETPKLNVAALAWQARGPGFESPMLH